MILFIRIDPSCVYQVCIFFLFFYSCLISSSRLDFVFIFLFSFIFFCSSWYLIEIKIYNNQLDQGTSPPSPYLTCFLLDSHVAYSYFALFSFKTYLRVSFLTLRTMFGLSLGGTYIDLYLFVLFYLVILKKKKKKNFCLTWGLCFEFVILLLLKEFHCFHAQFIAHARSYSDTTCCWRKNMIRKS